jgi:hypothetical protein
VLRRVPYYYVLLFLVAYATSVAYLKPSAKTAPSFHVEVAQIIPAVKEALHSTIPSSAGVSTRNSTAQLPATHAAPSTARTSAAEELPPLPPTALTVDTSSLVNSYMSLDTTVQSDERPEYRLEAVNALRTLATNGDADGRIRESLRMAMADGDPRVAAAAATAHREVVALTTTRR